MKTQTPEKRYLPQQALDLIQKSDYKRKDDLYCIVDLIYRRQVYFKTNLQKQYGFIDIPRASFQKLIARTNYIKDGIDFLIEEGIVRRNDYYQRGLQAKGYKISTEFLGSKEVVLITDKSINDRIKKDRLETRKRRVKNLEFAKSKYFKTFGIDREGALEAAYERAFTDIQSMCNFLKYNITAADIKNIIECTNDYVKHRAMILVQEKGKELHHILHRLMVHQQQIYSISDGFLFFHRNSTNGRLDTNLTSLPSYLRKFIRSDEKLFNLDIKNSQPYFLYTRLRSSSVVDKAELEYYGKMVIEGRLYEFLATEFERLTDRPKTRNEMKAILFKIFYSKTTSYEGYKKAFRSIFPTIMDHIDLTNTEEHKTLAIELQTLESFTILDVVMVELQSRGINPFTIHDSFIVTEAELEEVKSVFNEKLQAMYGIIPQLHEEELFNLSDDTEDEMYDDNEYELPEGF